ncbi:MAG: orotidine-5'-phosphate decarboxylase [Bacillota bacterium]|nr:orotidine-5'-phosphate decarboxylase [Bacillota bacterium]
MNINELQKKIIEKKSPVVVGLDPRLEKIPKSYRENSKISEALFAFNKDIIDGIFEIAPAVKLQIAFYEKYGVEGLVAYSKSKEYAKNKGLFVIGDIKRGDIGSTSKAYSNAHLGYSMYNNERIDDFEVDNVTVNPYLGEDCLNEFVDDIEKYDKSMFVLVKTSNKSSSQIQDIKKDGVTIYERVAEIVKEMNLKYKENYGPIGAVVGATYPSEMIALRKRMKKAYFLVPGYGAQGGTAKDVVNAFNEDGFGALVNSSRGIIFNYELINSTVEEGARQAVLEMNKKINRELENANKVYWK